MNKILFGALCAFALVVSVIAMPVERSTATDDPSYVLSHDTMASPFSRSENTTAAAVFQHDLANSLPITSNSSDSGPSPAPVEHPLISVADHDARMWNSRLNLTSQHYIESSRKYVSRADRWRT
ncbi:hypothetical protein [Sphingomonas sp.]|jgi:hypothetical protein|uniref:hypothetical protein n=1 Tax=Sphingomonas sp. TaxID=28214 RepID=UPI00356B0396